MEREDDFAIRRRKLAGLSDAELEKRFWDLTGRVVDPLIELAKAYTSPSIERSVLLRMGFSSLEAKAIVDKCLEHRLLGKGAGHVVYRLAREREVEVREAGRELAEGRGWADVRRLFSSGSSRAAAGGQAGGR